MTKRGPLDGNVLILNAGSSSLKWTILDVASESVIQQGAVTWPRGESSNHADEVQTVLQNLPVVNAAGHRVVHGGAAFKEAAIVTDGVRHAIEALTPLAPLHNPAALAGIDAVTAAFPGLPQVAAFDTAFHSTMDDVAALYPLPRTWTEQFGLRRFGFHGLSVMYSIHRLRELLDYLPPRVVACHLGAGCSITAVADGRSIDTSMGFTPLEGVMMATRSGSLDPGLLLYLLDQPGFTARSLTISLEEQSGLLGVSGISADLREVIAAADRGHQQARLAYEMFIHRIVRLIGAMIAVLGGLDAIIFTGGIGEHAAQVRRAVAARLTFTGLRLDTARNNDPEGDMDIAAIDSPVRAMVIAAREDLAILSEMKRLLVAQ